VVIDLRVEPLRYRQLRIGDEFIDADGTESVVTAITELNGEIVAYVAQPKLN